MSVHLITDQQKGMKQKLAELMGEADGSAVITGDVPGPPLMTGGTASRRPGQDTEGSTQ